MFLKPLILASVIAASYSCLFNHIYMFWASFLLLVVCCIVDSKKGSNDTVKI